MWYLVLSQNIRSDEARAPRTEPHLDWLEKEHQAGRVLFSGRTSDGSYGIYILLSDDLEQAYEIANQDPYHVHGDRYLEKIMEWNAQRAIRMDGMTIKDIEDMARHGTSAS